MPSTVYKSLFPIPPNVSQHTNAEYIFTSRPDQAQWPEEYTLYIEGETGTKMSNVEFWARVQDARSAIAGIKQSRKPGETPMIGIVGENSTDFSVIVHACLGLAIPIALISNYSTKFELGHAFKLSRPTSLFVSPRHVSVASAAAKEVDLPAENIFVFNGREKGRKSLDGMIAHVQRTKPEPAGIRIVDKSSLAYLVFSSGTTGLPKAVMISHGNVIYSVLQVLTSAATALQVWQPPPVARKEGIPALLAFLPFYHSYGLHAHVFRAFVSPMTHVIMKKWSVEGALKLIAQHQITGLAIVPSAVHQIVTHPATRKADLKSITDITSGAAYLPLELGEKIKSLMPNTRVRLAGGFGMSECTIAAMLLPVPGLFPDTLRSPHKLPTGILIPGQDARIVRENGSDAELGEVGELWLKGEDVCLGYYNNPEATKSTLVHEDGEVWLRTGDQFSTDGYWFFFADRAKDTLKVSGTQVSPTEIETVLRQQPENLINDVSVAGVFGGRTSDELVPRAWVVLTSAGKKLGEREVKKRLEGWSQEQLSRVKWLRGGIEVVSEIPKSPTGKVLRRVLQDKYNKRVMRGTKAKL